MEFIGKVSRILEERRGVSRNGNEYVNIEFVVTSNEEYPQSVNFFARGEQRCNQIKALRMGETVRVVARLDSDEFKGRYYLRATAQRIDTFAHVTGAGVPQQSYNPAPAEMPNTYVPNNGAPAPMYEPSVEENMNDFDF